MRELSEASRVLQHKRARRKALWKQAKSRKDFKLSINKTLYLAKFNKTLGRNALVCFRLPGDYSEAAIGMIVEMHVKIAVIKVIDSKKTLESGSYHIKYQNILATLQELPKSWGLFQKYNNREIRIVASQDLNKLIDIHQSLVGIANRNKVSFQYNIRRLS